MLDRIVNEKWLQARAVFGFYPAGSRGDDVVLFENRGQSSSAENRGQSREPTLTPASPRELETFHFLRQQRAKAEGRPNRCLADYVASMGGESSSENRGQSSSATLTPADWLGLFAVTAGLGIEKKLEEFEAAHDDYHAILLKALADRLAEAFAEHLHQRVRKEYWAYDAEETLDNEALITEAYRGIRPAPGYPACPDHSEKEKIFRLLDAPGNAGMTLTSGYAMLPTAAVCGYYFAHPQAEYFVLGPVLPDQLEDYAERKGISLEEARLLLPANLAD
jgi:5-methyltetrahydrofolate--homocysteine methyltransferase